MKKILDNLGTAIFLVVIIVASLVIVDYLKPQVNKIVDKVVDSEITLGGRGFTQLKPFAFNDTNGFATSTITGFNAVNIGTTTPTSTDFLFIGNRVDQVDMYLWVTVTSTDNGIVEWKLSFSPSMNEPINRNTTTMDFYFEDSNSISSSLITHVATDVVHRITPGDFSTDLKKITICGSNTDSAANTKISQCNAGVYKIEIGRPDGMSGFQLYAAAAIKESN